MYLSKTTFKTWSLLPGGLLIQGHLTENSIPWSWLQWSSRTGGRLIRVVALTGFTVESRAGSRPGPRRGLIFSQKRGKREEKGGKRGGKEEREIEKEGVKNGGKRKKRGKRMAGSIHRLNVHTSKVRLFPGCAQVHGPPRPLAASSSSSPPPPITHNVPIILMSNIQMINYPK